MSGFDATRRSAAAELMDADDVDFSTFRGCLHDLARVNRLSLGYRPTLGFLDRLRKEGRLPKDRPLAIVDVGSGYGDTLREIARWGGRHDVALALTGLDRNRWSARAAAEATDLAIGVTWVTADVFDHGAGYDLVLSALFTHHLDDGELVRFLRWSENTAALGWFVNDLRRSRLAYEGFRVTSRMLGMHRFVRHDGPVSFARSFTAADWRRSLAAAGVPEGDAQIERRAPFRLCVSRVRP